MFSHKVSKAGYAFLAIGVVLILFQPSFRSDTSVPFAILAAVLIAGGLFALIIGRLYPGIIAIIGGGVLAYFQPHVTFGGSIVISMIAYALLCSAPFLVLLGVIARGFERVEAAILSRRDN